MVVRNGGLGGPDVLFCHRPRTGRSERAFLSGQSQADPSGNYLGALSPAQKAAFQAGSFDVFAHPGTPWSNLEPTTDLSNLTQGWEHWIAGPGPVLVTGNNLGDYVGTGQLVPATGAGTPIQNFALEYVVNPHFGPIDPEDGPPGTVSYSTYYTGVLVSMLGGLSPFSGVVSGINDGRYTISNTLQRGSNGQLLWTPRLVSPLGYGPPSLGGLGGNSGMANALNNSNQVVGWSLKANGVQHAFLYSNGSMQDLNLLVPPLSGITLVSAVGIDSAGDIVAYGTNASGQMQEYYLSPDGVPAPEPSTLAVMGLVIASLAVRHVRARHATA